MIFTEIAVTSVKCCKVLQEIAFKTLAVDEITLKSQSRLLEGALHCILVLCGSNVFHNFHETETAACSLC